MIISAFFKKINVLKIKEKMFLTNPPAQYIRNFKKIALLAAVFLCVGILFQQNIQAQNVITGSDGVNVDISDKSGIISIGSSVTETIYALGAEENLVAVDITSVYPQEADSLPKVPYTRNLTAEGVLSLNPTLIVASESAGPESVIKQIRSTNTPFLKLPSSETLEGALQRIEKLGAIFEKEKKAGGLISDIKNKLASASKIKDRVESPVSVLFIYARGPNSLSVAGKNTSAETMIELAGAENAITNFEDYKPLNAEALAAANPDVILMMNSGLSSLGGIEGLLKAPGVSMTNAAKNERIYTMDGNYLLGFGPRLGEAVLDLMNKFYPDTMTADIITSESKK